MKDKMLVAVCGDEGNGAEEKRTKDENFKFRIDDQAPIPGLCGYGRQRRFATFYGEKRRALTHGSTVLLKLGCPNLGRKGIRGLIGQRFPRRDLSRRIKFRAYTSYSARRDNTMSRLATSGIRHDTFPS